MKPKSSSRGGWKQTLNAILREHNGTKSNHATASYSTQAQRETILFAGFEVLREHGYRLPDVRGFSTRHIEVLVKDWLARGLAQSTLQNNLSAFRTFAGWIEKQNVVKPTVHYFPNHEARRSSISRVDKTWTGNGVDVAVKLAEVRAVDARVALAMELQWAFGLRVEESLKFRPLEGMRGGVLHVDYGAKTGRYRTVPILTEHQRDVLARCQALVRRPSESMCEPRLNYVQMLNHYNAVMRRCGINKANGITSHGLRHEYANNRFKALSGVDSPVRRGEAGLGGLSANNDALARSIVAIELGHGRESVTTHYLGR